MRTAKGRKICIICEGYEEVEYFEALLKKSVFAAKYSLVLINAKSLSNIFSRYQEKYQSDSYSIVLIFCDTDRGPSEMYLNLKEKINKYHDAEVANDIIIFGNPCTMQIILSHFDKIKIKSQSKKTNSAIINKLTGIEKYNATLEQRNKLFSKINRDNYKDMKNNISQLPMDDRLLSSTNFLKFINYFENECDDWITEINDKL